MGGQDEGLYVAFSGILDHFGGVYYLDAFRNTLPEALRKLYDAPELLSMIPVGDGLHYYSAFYPLHPGWMAVFSGLFGADMHGLAVLLFSLLSVSGGYFLACELGKSDDRLAARLAALLMTVNPVLCFLAKFPLSETQTAALLLNAAYLLAKGLKVDGRKQMLLLGSSFLLVVAYFFTRPTAPILAAPWGALYLFSYSHRMDPTSARRVRAYLWMLVGGCLAAAIFYDRMQPYSFDQMIDVYWHSPHRQTIVTLAAMIALAGFIALAIAPMRDRLRPWLERGIWLVERTVLWLPLVTVLVSLPSVIEVVKTGRLFYWMSVAPGATDFHYTTIYRWMLALTPFLWGPLLALPWLLKPRSSLTIPILFTCATLVLTEAWAPALPYLYYHIRFLSSEVIPFSFVILSIVLAAMWRVPGWRHHLATLALLLAIPFMLVFSAVQLEGKEGENPSFFHELDRVVANNDVLVADERDLDNRFSVPLRYYFDKQLFLIPKDATARQVWEIFQYLLKNSGSKYGRILLLSHGFDPPLPISRTVQAMLTNRQSFIANPEHVMLGTFGSPTQSRSFGRFLLPYSWHTLDTVFTLYRVTGVPTWDDHVSLGCPIDFSANGNSEFYTGDGWSHQEAGLRWTDANSAVLRVRLQDLSEALALNHTYMDFRAASFGSQRVIVSVDGKQISELHLNSERRDYEVEFNLENPDPNLGHEIVFKLPDAHSPKSINLNQDSRNLGISVLSITFFGSTKTSGKCN
jgi:hypothetical protein